MSFNTCCFLLKLLYIYETDIMPNFRATPVFLTMKASEQVFFTDVKLFVKCQLIHLVIKQTVKSRYMDCAGAC